MLLIMRPAAISRPQDTATSATTSAPLNRPIRRPVDPRLSSFTAAATLVPVACSAGIVPANTAAAAVMPSTNSITR